jgi:thymidylate synthase ThyX
MLNVTPDVSIVDDLSPEDLAMLQALYSRSAESHRTHLEKVKRSGSGKFMSKYYVGYGHKSIADCGTTTIFLEDVSILAAKAIQDWPLYSGQETSTRYIDMSARKIVDPIGSEESGAIQKSWMNFYNSAQGPVSDLIRTTYPRKQNESEEDYERAVKARTFDSLRGFLPAGLTTQLSWHTNLRQAKDHLAFLKHHPTLEAAELAKNIDSDLARHYPSSGFAIPNRHAEIEEWERLVGNEYALSVEDRSTEHVRFVSSIRGAWSMDDLLRARPRGGLIPHFLTMYGQNTFSFLLDYGSFRDIQRHRNGVCRIPLLTTKHGMEPWYIDQLGPDLGGEALDFVDSMTKRIERLPATDVERQYYVALGYRVPTVVTYSLPATVYILELRSGKMIHPTLRSKILEMAFLFKQKFPNIPIYVDNDADDWDVRRGRQTIIEKGI